MRWKKYMIEQLEGLDLDVWPKALLKYLKKVHTFDTDEIYQADVSYTIKNYICNS